MWCRPVARALGVAGGDHGPRPAEPPSPAAPARRRRHGRTLDAHVRAARPARRPRPIPHTGDTPTRVRADSDTCYLAVSRDSADGATRIDITEKLRLEPSDSKSIMLND